MTPSAKLAICTSCIYHEEFKVFGKVMTTCGPVDLTVIPPIIGKTVVHEGKEIKLCGCVMNIKKLLNVSCPAGFFTVNNGD